MTTVADTRALDAAYRPFPTFAAWQARTTVESPRWSALVTRVKEAKAAAATLTARALEVAKRAAAFDTGAIENLYETDRGFTYSVAFETGAWELGLLERGEQVRPLFEAQMRAYDLVLSLATGSEPVSEAAIRELHSVICAAQDTYQVMTAVGPQNQPLPKGVYKALPNHVRTRKGDDHAYAPVDLTPAEMHRLVQELRSEAFLAAHPIQQAAYAHYCFVAIHSFADGNGRVARALASLYTYRAASAPIIILSEDKPRYLDALAEADQGTEQAFVDFLLAQSISTLALVDDNLQGASEPSLGEVLVALKDLVGQDPNLTADEIDRRARLFAGLFTDSVETTLLNQTSLFLESDHDSGYNREAPDLYRALQNEFTFLLRLSVSLKSGVGTVYRDFHLYAPLRAEGSEEILLIADKGPRVAIRLDDLYAKSGFLQLRMDAQAERVAAHMVTELIDQVRNRKVAESKET